MDKYITMRALESKSEGSLQRWYEGQEVEKEISVIQSVSCRREDLHKSPRL